MPVLGERAVVLGASMGGLLAARVLADFFESVTVVERDVLPDDPANRRGVPQGRPGHDIGFELGKLHGRRRWPHATQIMHPGHGHALLPHFSGDRRTSSYAKELQHS